MNVLQRPPKSGDVWLVQDDKVVLHTEGREDKGQRFVLVLSASDLDIKALGVANVVPLSTRPQTDRYCFPITSCYEELAPGFTPDKNCHAVTNWYQPIEVRYFTKFRGHLNETCQVAVKSLVQTSVLGIADYNFEI